MRHGGGEGGFELFVIGAEADEGLDFALRQGHERGVVVALVGAAGNPDEGRIHAVQGVPGGFHVGGLAVVEEAHTINFAHGLQAVFGVLESGQAGFDLGGAQAGHAGAEHGRQQVLTVVLPDERRVDGAQVLVGEVIHAHGVQHGVQHGFGGVIGRQVHVGAVVPAEGQALGAGESRLKIPARYLIVGVVDEEVVAVEVAGDAQLGLGIFLQAVIVAVEVVGRDVEQHRHPGPEVVGVVELKGAELDHVILEFVLYNLLRQREAHVAGQAHAKAGFLEQMISQQRRRGLAVGAGDADALGFRVAAGKLYLRDDGRVLGAQGLDDGGFFRDAGAFHDLVGGQNFG